MQVLRSTKVDRIIFQRAACNAMLCGGVGTFRGFWGGYLAAIMDAANVSNIPVYIRWSWTERNVNPLYLSTKAIGYIIDTNKDPTYLNKLSGIHLKPRMCFENVIRRGPEYHGNFHGSISPEAIQDFKKTSYESTINLKTNLPTYFDKSSPYVILISYRGKTTRHIANINDMINTFRTIFRVPDYYIHTMDNGNSHATSEMQLKQVAEANVVITNHGAFEGNLVILLYQNQMIYFC